MIEMRVNCNKHNLSLFDPKKSICIILSLCPLNSSPQIYLGLQKTSLEQNKRLMLVFMYKFA